MFAPGGIWWAELEIGRRPVIVVSRAEQNQGSYVVAVLCTSTNFSLRSSLPNCVPFQAGEFGMPKDCVAQGEAIQFIEKDAIDSAAGLIGQLDSAKLRDLVRAIGHVLDADCEPM